MFHLKHFFFSITNNLGDHCVRRFKRDILLYRLLYDFLLQEGLKGFKSAMVPT